MSSTPPPETVSATTRARLMTAAVLLVSFLVYALTISDSLWTTDVFGANWTSWHLVSAGNPWIDGTRIPEVGQRSDHLLAIVHTANGHTAFGRFPGVVVASLPAYLIASDSMSTVPGSITAALLTACALALLFNALRRYLPDSHALLATAVFGFATPVWTVSANLMWPHTITVLGIAGMAWASSRDRWWLVGVFGGIALLGRLHVALVVAVLGLGVGIRRRDWRLVAKTATTSGLFLLATCAWNRWVYGSWNPLGGYGDGLGGTVASYSSSVPNYLGMWIAPDRGILVWTPAVAILIPALVRAWRGLPDWSRFLFIGGLAYTVIQSAMIVFSGGTGFYGYRYGLEFLACAAPALALSAPRMGRLAQIVIGPVLALQAFAFLLGALYENLYLDETRAWHANAFVNTADRIGPAAWLMTAAVAAMGFFAARRIIARHRATTTDLAEPADRVSV